VGVHETSFDPMDGGALVSIGMPVYNGAIYLQRAIQSVLGQNYSNLELMIKLLESHRRATISNLGPI